MGKKGILKLSVMLIFRLCNHIVKNNFLQRLYKKHLINMVFHTIVKYLKVNE